MSGRPVHVERNLTSIRFWPEGLCQLVVVSFQVGNDIDGTWIAYGIDADRRRLVLQVELRTAQLNALIAALRDGWIACNPGKDIGPASRSDEGLTTTIGARLTGNGLVTDDTVPPVVVIPNSGPTDPGPNALALATAIHAERLTADAARASRP
jgi:hypothetical protein